MNASTVPSAARAAGLNALDRAFAAFIMERAPNGSPELGLAAAWLSFAVRNGHTCLPLESSLRAPVFADLEEPPDLPEAVIWEGPLRRSGIVGSPGDLLPIILDGGLRLYLHRYWEYEDRLAREIEERCVRLEQEPGCRALLRERLDRLFPAGEGVDWQRLAAFTAWSRRFCVITGGPGTGKTWTLARILALFLEEAPALHIALAAPTGRAAARMRESIEAARNHLQSPVRDLVPSDARTIHRLLGTTPNSPYFQHNRENRLPVNLVVVDEASMADLPLLSKLCEALLPDARLILVGDSDQLASVEAGSVLADLCRARNRFSLAFADQAQEWGGITIPEQSVYGGTGEPVLSDSVVELQTTHRFGGGSGIFRFCNAVRNGLADEAFSVCREGGAAGVTLVEIRSRRALEARLEQLVEAEISPWFFAGGPEICLQRYQSFRLLCAVRNGPCGVSHLNETVESILTKRGFLSYGGHANYPGRPVLITVNDYAQSLFNGDTGIVVREEVEGKLRIAFPGEGASLRFLHPAGLPAHETAYAMTAHKSQGSEFDTVVLVLPERDVPILSRELIYTAASRAKRRVEIWGMEAILRTAIERRVLRSSGLADRLWGESNKNRTE